MRRRLGIMVILVFLVTAPVRAEGEAAELGRAVRSLLSVLDWRIGNACLSGRLAIEVGGGRETIRFRYLRVGREYEVRVDHERYGFRLVRRVGRTVLAVSRHRVAFVGVGRGVPENGLSPEGSVARLVSDRTAVRSVLRWASDVYALAGMDPALAGVLLRELAGFCPGEEPGCWRGDDGSEFLVSSDGVRFRIAGAEGEIEVGRVERGGLWTVPDDWETVPVERGELERTVSRGVRRALEVFAPGPAIRREEVVAVAHGSLRRDDDGLLVRLWGRPAEIGRAHAGLLMEEARLCLDSTVHMTGLAYTLEKGRWFLDDLRAAWKRLSPHVPERFRVEMRALADGLGEDRELVELANVFPEMFHCSGFAVFGAATKDGKLYHGRVLDYMTEIGLQDSAAVFVVAPEGRRRFVTVGYAGFIGSVSGMNEDGISLGEMGGRGEGDWDGVPMATLMRRALEECGTLDEVIDLWRRSPRTCEYYYVFADGKGPDAVGVAATPDRLEVIRAGESHPKLGEGIPDAVVLSAGDRLKALRERILARHGDLDEASSVELMSRPVAMRSNLHDVLFVPEDLVLLVAQAGRDRPACEMPYRRIDFGALFRKLPPRSSR